MREIVDAAVMPTKELALSLQAYLLDTVEMHKKLEQEVRALEKELEACKANQS